MTTRLHLDRAPRMVPVSGHRCFLGGRGTFGHPVLSIWQTGIPGLIGGLEQGGAAVCRTDTAGDIAVVGRSVEEDLQVVSRGSPLPPPR